MAQYLTSSEQETKKLARKFAKIFQTGIIALIGELGSGKTTFVQGFAKGLGIKEKIISPTFVLIRQHKIPKTKKVLYHIDLYRLEKNYSQELGLEEIINDPKNIVVIEWAEKIEKNLLDKTIKINIEKKQGNTRLITIS